MKIKTRDFEFKTKEVRADGFFSGYLSVFGVLDSYRDIVEPGAFTESLATWEAKGRLPPVLWQHNSNEPVGPFTKMVEDDTGLYVEGMLLVEDVQRAREARALLKSKTISGMSIGFSTDAEQFDEKNNINHLTKLTLWEGSFATFPANDSARVDVVKSALTRGKLPSLSEFEKFLREAGFSKSQATALAGRGLGYLLRGKPDRPKIDVAFLADIVKSIPYTPR